MSPRDIEVGTTGVISPTWLAGSRLLGGAANAAVIGTDHACCNMGGIQA